MKTLKTSVLCTVMVLSVLTSCGKKECHGSNAGKGHHACDHHTTNSDTTAVKSGT